MKDRGNWLIGLFLLLFILAQVAAFASMVRRAAFPDPYLAKNDSDVAPVRHPLTNGSDE